MNKLSVLLIAIFCCTEVFGQEYINVNDNSFFGNYFKEDFILKEFSELPNLDFEFQNTYDITKESINKGVVVTDSKLLTHLNSLPVANGFGGAKQIRDMFLPNNNEYWVSRDSSGWQFRFLGKVNMNSESYLSYVFSGFLDSWENSRMFIVNINRNDVLVSVVVLADHIRVPMDGGIFESYHFSVMQQQNFSTNDYTGANYVYYASTDLSYDQGVNTISPIYFEIDSIGNISQIEELIPK